MSPARLARDRGSAHRTLIAMHLDKDLQVGAGAAGDEDSRLSKVWPLRLIRRSYRALSIARADFEMTFQGLILKLSEFWASRGCVLQQPLDVEVGAGTMHPGDVSPRPGAGPLERRLRAAVAAAGRRPVRREPRTARSSIISFRSILKPAPDEVQQLYLDSLEACGINPRQHDIRFEEDNWESPTLGAWGIGWQVMFDGMEISQFTYFQQAGGLELSPISAGADLRPRAHRDGAAARRQHVRSRVGRPA
mgnify:CR=1 FL=1